MAAKALPEQDVLVQLLRYDPDTGKLFWKERPVSMFPAVSTGRSAALCRLWNARYSGQEAFTSAKDGYANGSVFGTNYVAHRVIWKLIYGIDPDQVDHIDGDRRNNRLENLRDVSLAENAKNKRMLPSNKTGIVGVSRWAQRGYVYWAVSRPGTSDKYFKCIGQAIRARREAERRHGFHPNHGRAA